MSRSEVVLADECIVHDDSVATPGRAPTPSSPSTPAMAEKSADGNANVEENARMNRRIVPTGIRIINGRSPNPYWIVHRHIDHLGVCRQNFHDWFACIRRIDDLLLWG